jgi:hypothetical protein
LKGIEKNLQKDPEIPDELGDLSFKRKMFITAELDPDFFIDYRKTPDDVWGGPPCATFAKLSIPSYQDKHFTASPPGAMLQQGDILEHILRLIPPKDIQIDVDKSAKIQIGIEYCNVIILTQTCDLHDKDVDLILVAPLYNFDEYIENLIKKRSDEGKNPIKKSDFEIWKKNKLSELIKNPPERYYFLPGCRFPGFINDDIIIDFGGAFGLDYEYVNNVAKGQGFRITLKSEFKYNFSHRLGNHFSRIDVPDEIPGKEIDIPDILMKKMEKEFLKDLKKRK